MLLPTAWFKFFVGLNAALERLKLQLRQVRSSDGAAALEIYNLLYLPSTKKKTHFQGTYCMPASFIHL